VRSHLLTLKWWFMAPGELSWSLSPLQVKIKYSFIPRDMLLIIKCQLRSQKATRACPAGERERERESFNRNCSITGGLGRRPGHLGWEGTCLL